MVDHEIYSLKTQSEVPFATRKLLIKESLQHFEKAVEKDPRDELAHLHLALEHALARDLELAMEHCQKSLEKNPKQPAAIMLMALLFSARKDYKSALELVIEALTDFPDSYGLLVLRLKLEAKFGRVEEALNTSNHLLKFLKKIPVVNVTECLIDATRQANIWVELAELFLEMDRITEVQACVEEACSIFQNSYQAIYLKGRLFQVLAQKMAKQDTTMSKRLKNEAKACFLGSLSLFPAHIPSLKSLSKIYRRDGNLKMAEKMLRDVITIEPLDATIWHLLGLILAEENRFDEAYECFETSIALESNTPLLPFFSCLSHIIYLIY